MNKPPFATIIVPTYNQEAFLAQALDSVLSQTDPDWEAIVVNDGSTDRTAEIAESYVRRDGRIRYIYKPNGGVASALNVGLKNARGDWIHWLSSDDMFEANKLAINRRWIEQHRNCNFFFSYFTLLRQATGAKERRELWGPLPDPAHQILTLLYRNYVSGITICIRRAAWESVGFFDESLYYAQDYGQWLRLLQKNQAVFIPEWTVINRNHEAQGSETFADACYFDTAKAAIRFLNHHSFPELVPRVNLSEREGASKALTCALDVACDRTAFLYCLGAHPALVLRVLEWVFSGSCTVPELRNFVRSRITQMSLVEGDDDWAWMWRQLAVAVEGGRHTFIYGPIDTTQLALREYQSRAIRGEPRRAKLHEYLLRFADVNTDGELPAADGNARIAFLIDRTAEIAGVRRAADRLARRGFRPVWLVSGEHDGSALEWDSWVSSIRVNQVERDVLPWLGEVEHCVTLHGREQPTWLASLRHTQLGDTLSAAEVEQLLKTDLGYGEKHPLRTVAFLERVLWGGGAERVVFDIVRHLDRRRFRGVILTMFEEQTAGPELPQHIDVFNVRHELSVGSNSNEAPMVGDKNYGQQRDATNRWVRGFRRLYRRILTQSARTRLRQRLSMLKQSISPKQRLPSTAVLDFDFIGAMACHSPAAVGLARIMRKLGEDVVLVTVMEEAAVVAWLAQAAVRFPYLVSLHIFESKYLRAIYPDLQREIAERHLLSAACNDADTVVFPSQGCCSDLERNFPVGRARIRSIWNPVDCARVRRQSFQRLEAVEDWRKKAQCFRMVHVGRLDPQKNHDLLLDACRELKGRERAFSLAIVGDGHDRLHVQQRIDALGVGDSAFVAGEQPNPFPWIAAADVLLLTSQFEAFALVLVEAMVCGVPVISVDCPAGPSEVLNKGEFGLLVPNDDPRSFADAVERLMNDPSLARRLSGLGYQRAEAFDVKKIISEWEALLGALPTQK